MKSVHLCPSAEQSLLQAARRRSPGLLLGQAWEQRSIVLAAVPTPPLPKSEEGGKGGWSRSDWFREHARQVARLCVGGVELIGCFVTEDKSSGSSSDDRSVCDLLYSLPLPPSCSDRLLVRVPASASKLSAEVYPLSQKDAAKPKPVSTLKTTPLATSLTLFDSTVDVDLTLPVQSSDKGTPLRSQLQSALDSFAETVREAAVRVDGRSVDGATVLDKLEGESNSGGGGGKGGRGGKGSKGNKKGNSKIESDSIASSSDLPLHPVEFFLRPPEVPDLSESAGYIRVQGAVNCRVYAFNKYTVAQAIEVLSEDSEDAWGAFDLPSEKQHTFTWSMPRRMYQPIGQAAVLCDYLLPHEQESDGVTRIAELLGLDSDGVQQLAAPFTREQCAEGSEGGQMGGENTAQGGENQVEAAASSDTIASAAPSSSSPSTTAAASKPSSSSLLLLAFLALLLAVSAAFFLQLQ